MFGMILMATMVAFLFLYMNFHEQIDNFFTQGKN
jgi:hypothetical protein